MWASITGNYVFIPQVTFFFEMYTLIKITDAAIKDNKNLIKALKKREKRINQLVFTFGLLFLVYFVVLDAW